MSKLKFLLVISLSFFSACIHTAIAETLSQQITYSENEQLKFSQLSTTDGLSNSNVFGITQDHQGFIWFATEDGLNRFDGNNFVTYRHNANDKHSIADNV
ncbi:MAG: hypothetical protein OQK03_10395, partial [Colwellia sp.]|nr:hypothetical protein [Colwellia sp.]